MSAPLPAACMQTECTTRTKLIDRGTGSGCAVASRERVMYVYLGGDGGVHRPASSLISLLPKETETKLVTPVRLPSISSSATTLCNILSDIPLPPALLCLRSSCAAATMPPCNVLVVPCRMTMC